MMRKLPLATVALLLVLAGCGGTGGGDKGGDKRLTVWSLEDNPARVQRQEAIIDRFNQTTGMQARLVPVNEDQFPTLIAKAAAAGDLPDVIGSLSMGNVHRLVNDHIADQDAAAEVIDKLGRGTFAARALELYARDGKPVAVPSDGWAQILLYRKDLFAKAGLAAPTTYEAIKAAADKLQTGAMAGITAATKPGDTFTQQTFEHVALANGCQLTDDKGNVTLDSPRCVHAIRFYTDLIKHDSVKGGQDTETTRATYFAGKAAMIIWSTFILDELAGLRNDALPACPECTADPAYLAKHSGIVTALKGPDGAAPSGYGEISGWSITARGNVDGAKRFVEYMLSDAYLDWIGLAPEGKFPVRAGTKDDPGKFRKAWDQLEAGVDKQVPLSSIYPPETLEIIRDSARTLNRWGFPQGQGALAGALLGELPVPKALATVLDGQATPEQAARQAKADVEALARSVK